VELPRSELVFGKELELLAPGSIVFLELVWVGLCILIYKKTGMGWELFHHTALHSQQCSQTEMV